jgi:exodeoxyribonuclease VII small subunit
MTNDPTLGFEDALAALEERVRKLEAGEIPLDQALALFEEGVQLAATCHEHLDEAEDRVAALSRGPRGPVERPFEDR